jgi:hypothetical protein
MNIENILPWVAYLLIVAVIGGPVAFRLYNNLTAARRRRKATPGPLLGVVYPENKKKGRK